MEAQTQCTPEDQEPTTPVIIKTSGDWPPGSSEVNIVIDRPGLSFTEWEPTSEGWKSQSVLTGRIQHLSILKNPDEPARDAEQLYPDYLAEIKIQFGSTHFLVFREAGNTTDKNVVTVIESVGAEFKGDTAGEWTIARASFPPITNVLFLGGNRVLLGDDEVCGTNPTLTIKFPKLADG